MNIQKKRPYNRWTEEETRTLVEKYSALGIKKMMVLLNRTFGSILRKKKNLNLHIDKEIYEATYTNQDDVSIITEIKTPFAAYFLGYFWADGHVCKRIKTIERKTNGYGIVFSIAHRDFLKIKSELFGLVNWGYSLRWDKNPNHSRIAILRFHNKKLWKFLEETDHLIKSGASPDKILDKIPENLRHYWWRGYFDGDGCLYFNKKSYSIYLTLSSCRKQKWDFIDKLCKQLKIDYNIRQNVHGSAFYIQAESFIKKFCDYIYQGELFGLLRKRDKYLAYLDYKTIARPDKQSSYRGVKPNYKGGKKWIMEIYRYKPYREYFDNEIDAAKRYDVMAKELHGNKAVLNFPNE